MIVIGLGCRRGCSAAAITTALTDALTQARLGTDDVTALAVPAFKLDEPGIRAAARALGLTVAPVERDALDAAQADCATSSDAVRRAVGLGSVAEAAALAAAGPEARLLLPRIARDGVTCAVAASVAAVAEGAAR
jgi:cobalt-precorrin 5A hydrolase